MTTLFWVSWVRKVTPLECQKLNMPESANSFFQKYPDTVPPYAHIARGVVNMSMVCGLLHACVSEGFSGCVPGVYS